MAFQGHPNIFRGLCYSGPLSFWPYSKLLVVCSFSNLSMDFVRDPTADVNARREVFRYYGTFSRSFLTMFATITLPNFCFRLFFFFTPCICYFDYWYYFFQPMVACHISKVVSTCFLQEKNILWILWEGFCSIQYLRASACCCLALLLLFAGSALCELGPSMPCPCGQHQPMVYTFLSDFPVCIWLCHIVPWKQVRNFRSTYQGYSDSETL